MLIFLLLFASAFEAVIAVGDKDRRVEAAGVAGVLEAAAA